jgi:hypothetical protein
MFGQRPDLPEDGPYFLNEYSRMGLELLVLRITQWLRGHSVAVSMFDTVVSERMQVAWQSLFEPVQVRLYRHQAYLCLAGASGINIPVATFSLGNRHFHPRVDLDERSDIATISFHYLAAKGLPAHRVYSLVRVREDS